MGEGGLVDHVCPCSHLRFGERCAFVRIVSVDLDDIVPGRSQRFEKSALVKLTVASD